MPAKNRGPRRQVIRLACVVLGLAAWIGGTTASACPFCTVESQTLSEEIDSVDAAVLAKLVREAATVDSAGERSGGFTAADGETGDAVFEIVDVLRGKQHLADTTKIRVVFFGPSDPDQLFMITGIGTEPVEWTTPLPLSAAAVDYVHQLEKVAPGGADRLAFFQDYLEHEDPLLAQDAYDEFARAPYSDLQTLGDRMKHDQLMAWINDPEVSPSGRRLYLTMLGACGTEDDLPMLEEMIVSDYEAKKPIVEGLVQSGLAQGGPWGLLMWPELVQLAERRKKLGLDALVASYLALRGPDGLDLIDARFLTPPDVEFTHIYSTIMALRFHGDSTDMLPRERLLASMRLLLDNPDFADQVIIDLARWEDWSILDQLVEMFQTADENKYIRPPIVTYLTVASEQEGDVGERAQDALAELERLDPEAVEQARSLAAFGFLARARATNELAGATRPEPDDGLSSDSDSLDIPDPVDYGTQDAPEPNDDYVATDATNTPAEASEPAGEENSDLEGDEPDAAPESAVDSSPVAAQSPASSTGPLASQDFVPPSRWWIIGVPVAAAVLLMGLFWLILRSRAV